MYKYRLSCGQDAEDLREEGQALQIFDRPFPKQNLVLRASWDIYTRDVPQDWDKYICIREKYSCVFSVFMVDLSSMALTNHA
jgi:hypothetical protein